ncbi:MAG: alginate lyase family protein [Egibacteraceae bacterium]
MLLVALLLGSLTVLRPWSGPGQPIAEREKQGGQDDGPPPTMLGPQLGYLVDVSDLRHRALLASQGVEPYSGALVELLGFADNALDARPRPEEPLQSNGPDGRFGTDAGDAYGLGLAYVITGERRYAEKAAEFIMSWVSTTKSTKKSCPDSGACPTSLLVSRHAPGFVFSASLISDAGVLSSDDLSALRGWLTEVILPATSQRTNNWGDAGTFARLVVADYIGDERAFVSAARRWRELMDMVEDDGEIPEETRRGEAGMVYTQGALTYKVATATIAARRGIDLWSYEGEKGGTLKEAVDLLARYWDHPDDWPFDPNPNRASPSPMWELAYQRWQDTAILSILIEERPFNDNSNSAIRWTTLTNGLPD